MSEEIDYLKYPFDIPAVSESGAVLTETVDGKLKAIIKHHKGDYILDKDGNKLENIIRNYHYIFALSFNQGPHPKPKMRPVDEYYLSAEGISKSIEYLDDEELRVLGHTVFKLLNQRRDTGLKKRVDPKYQHTYVYQNDEPGWYEVYNDDGTFEVLSSEDYKSRFGQE